MTFRRTAIYLLLATVVIVALAWTLQPPKKQSLAAGMRAMEACFSRGIGTEDDVSLACVRPRVESLLESFQAADIMDAFDASTTPEAVARSCHSIGHIIGRSVYTHLGATEPALALCKENCAGACVHGVTAAAVEAELGETFDSNIVHFSAEKLRTVSKRYCEKSSTLCHAIGHLFRMQAGSYREALQSCDAMGRWRADCASGVFMEDASALESDIAGITTSFIAYDSFAEPCVSIEAQYQSSCFRFLYLYQNQLFAARSITSKAQQVEISKATCASLEGDVRTRCYFGIGGSAHRVMFDTTQGVGGFCDTIPSANDRRACDNGLHNRTIDSAL